MDFLQIICFALVQGIGEFIPISSSTHLVLLKHFFHLDDIPIFFDIFLHVATLGSLLIFFRDRVISCVSTLCLSFKLGFKPLKTKEGQEDQAFILFICISTIFTGIFGLTIQNLSRKIDFEFLTPYLFLLTAFLLVISHFVSQRKENKSFIVIGKWGIYAILLGIIQGLATLPGLSRSGSTISVLLLLGFSRNKVAQLSFLMSVPPILGAALLDSRDVDWPKLFSLISPLNLTMGFILTFIVGYLSLCVLKRLLEKAQIVYFAPYLVMISLWLFFS